jgi:hypothetical protein
VKLIIEFDSEGMNEDDINWCFDNVEKLANEISKKFDVVTMLDNELDEDSDE